MTTATQDKFQIGDRVLHPGKPEWGVGTVASAAGAVHEGAQCQRLGIRFDRAGLKTISTAFVSLRRASKVDSVLSETKPLAEAERFSGSGSGSGGGGAMLGAFSSGSGGGARSERGFGGGGGGGGGGASGERDPFGPPPAHGLPADPRELRRKMTAIPDDAVDPFQTDAARLRAVLGLYRFEPTPGSLIDWAAAQSGLSDPLSHFSRHELEEYFGDFQRNLDKALGKAVADAAKVPAAELRTIAQNAPPLGQRALQALHRRR
jgi:hypothetical protein